MPDFPAIGSSSPVDVISTPASSKGIEIDNTTAANTKGAWSELIAATTIPASWLYVGVISPGTDYQVLVDIGIGASTAEKVLIPNLYADCIATGNQARSRHYLFPVSIPAGSRLSARYQDTDGASLIIVSLQLFPSTFFGSAPLGRIEAGGIDLATTRLTPVDPGAVVQTDSTPVELIASTSFPYKWLNVNVAHGVSVGGAAASWRGRLMIGAVGVEKVLMHHLNFRGSSSADSPHNTWYFPCSVPAGSRLSLSMRSSTATATDRVQDWAVWGAG